MGFKTTINYNGNIIYSTLNNATITLPTNGKLSTSNIIINSTANRCPDGYKELNYIKLVSGSYINLNFAFTSSMCLHLDYMDTTWLNDEHLFGSDAGAAYTHFTWYNGTGTNQYYWGNNGSESHGGTWSSGWHFLIMNNSNSQVVHDDIVLGSISSPNSNGKNMYLGRRDNAICDSTIYSLKIFSDKTATTLFRNFIPCKRTSDSAIGLYDLINNVWYGNSGSGSILAGPEV